MKISDRTRASATACATDARGEGARAAAMGATFSWVVGLLMSRDSRVGMPTKFKAHAARARVVRRLSSAEDAVGARRRRGYRSSEW